MTTDNKDIRTAFSKAPSYLFIGDTYLNHSDLLPGQHLAAAYPCRSLYANLAIPNNDDKFPAKTLGSFYSPFPSMTLGSKPDTSVTEIHAAKQSLSSKFIVSI